MYSYTHTHTHFSIHTLTQLEPIKDESSESEEDEEEPDERENVLSFRNAPQDMGGYADGVEEGDLGLGTEGKRTYQVHVQYVQWNTS